MVQKCICSGTRQIPQYSGKRGCRVMEGHTYGKVLNSQWIISQLTNKEVFFWNMEETLRNSEIEMAKRGCTQETRLRERRGKKGYLWILLKALPCNLNVCLCTCITLLKMKFLKTHFKSITQGRKFCNTFPSYTNPDIDDTIIFKLPIHLRK